MKEKLTLVSIWHRGVRKAFLVMAQVDQNGKAKIPQETLTHMLAKAGVINGSTYWLGG